ncbi:hypothetical protein [Luteolibacter sp. AS25]|uniref:hypothetical protein n=1 Tax=Luteolibacter sp. AS25 TaxID=3135776 RepID=UPI00398AE5A8
MLSETELNKELERLDQEFRAKRKALMAKKRHAKKVATNKKTAKKRRAVTRVKNDGPPKRAIARRLIAATDGSFSLTTLMAAAKAAGDTEGMSINSASWSSILVFLKRIGHVDVLEQAVGNKAAVYRLCVSKTELLKERKVGGRKPSPLKNTILEAFQKMPSEGFERTDLYAFLSEQSPSFKDDFHLDSVGAVLNRLARREEGVRVVEYKKTGNIYEPIR